MKQRVGIARAFASGAFTEPFALSARDVPTPIISFIQDALVYRILAKPEIKTLDDLRGKTMAVSNSGALSEQIIRICLAKAGQGPEHGQVPAGWWLDAALRRVASRRRRRNDS